MQSQRAASLGGLAQLGFVTGVSLDDFRAESLVSLEAAARVAVFRAADDSLVVEVDLPVGDIALRRIVTTAKARGVDVVWARGRFRSGERFGFRRRRGYARLQALDPLVGSRVEHPPLSLVPELQIECYSGVWGHHRPALEADPDATFVGLREGGRWVGICEVDLERRLVDSPGLIPRFRTADRFARLVLQAASLFTPGCAVTLETWGDDDATLYAYHRLGFELVEYVPAWELVVPHDRPPLDVVV